jgi:uncharacterized membrane protein
MLLVMQALAVTTSAWALFAIALNKVRSYVFALTLLCAYLLFFGVQYALDFDFHVSVLSSAALAWSLYALHFRKWWLYWLVFVLGLITREDISLFYFMIGLYLLIFHWKNKKLLASITMIISLTYFFVVAYVVMPQWTPGHVPAAYFDATGSKHGFLDILSWFTTHPFQILHGIIGSEVNRNTLRQLFQSFGYLPALSPFSYLTMAPNIIARFLSDEYQRHLLSFHYNASLGSLLSYGAILTTAFIMRVVKKITRLPRVVSAIPLLFAAFIAYGTYASSWRDTDLPLHKLSNPNFVNAEFQPRLSRGAMDILVNMIPVEKSVSAASGLVPQLSGRPYIFNFPEPLPKQTQWVILSAEFNTWPLPKGEMLGYIDDYKKNPNYKIVWQDYGIWSFKKKVPSAN